MATVPVARDAGLEEGWDGVALTRVPPMKDSEYDVARKLAVQRAVEDIDRLVESMDVLRKFMWCGEGQEFLVTCKRGREIAANRFRALIRELGVARDGEVVVEVEWDGRMQPGAVMPGQGAEEYVLRRRMPPAVTQEDMFMIDVYEHMRSRFHQMDIDWLSNPPGYRTLRSKRGDSFLPRPNASALVAASNFRPQRYSRKLGRYPGIVNDTIAFIAAQCQQSSCWVPFMTTHVHLVRGRSEDALSRRSSFVVDSDAGDSSDAGDEAVDDSISSDACDSSDDDDSDDSSDDDDSDDLSPTPYESTIVSCKADTREGAETWSYWAEAFSNVEFSGHLDRLWANRRSNDLQLHCNRYCIVIDTATGQEGRRQDKSLRTIDIVVYPSFRGRGHGRRTAHCVVRRLVRQGLTVQCTVSTQSKAKPVQKIFNTVPGVVILAIGNMFTFSAFTDAQKERMREHRREEKRRLGEERRAADPLTPVKPKLKRSNSTRTSRVGVHRELVTWTLDSSVQSLPAEFRGTPVRVIGAPMGTKMKQYIVDVAGHTWRELQRVSGLRASAAPDDMGAAVTSYMKQAEEITAQQILAQRQTMTGLRRENQMYRRHGMLQLYGYRMRPRVYEVANIIETVLDEIDTVRQIDGPTGEAGYFPYGDAITLGFDILEDTLKCKPARDFARIAFSAEALNALACMYRWGTSDGSVRAGIRLLLGLSIDPVNRQTLETVYRVEAGCRVVVNVVLNVPGWPDVETVARCRKVLYSGVDMAGYDYDHIAIDNVYTLHLVTMFDHGTRWRARQTEKEVSTKTTSGPLASGGTVCCVKLVDAVALSESTAVNCIPVQLFNGSDNLENKKGNSEELEISLRAAVHGVNDQGGHGVL